MEKIVFDTFALVAFFFNEKEAQKVEKIIKEASRGGKAMLMSAVNYGELFYAVYKKAGRESAVKAVQMAEAIPVRVEPVNSDTALLAAGYKALKKMSYADCFAAALAKIHNAPLVTGDREFQEVEGEIKIIWL